MSSTAAAPPPRGPLVDLPLSLYLPPINANHNYDSLPSPVSLPLKRGPPTPIREGSSLHSTTTPKRRISRDMLDADDLGTGKSPARLLFTPPSSSSSRSAKPSAKTPTALAPSPPMASRRSARLAAAAAAAKSKSAATPTVSVSKDPIHAPGFVIFADTRPVRPSFTTGTKNALVLVPFIHDDQENTPPPPCAEVARTPMTSRRNRTMERSKLGTQSVIAPPPPTPTTTTTRTTTMATTKAAVMVVSEAAAAAISGKEGMKLEADAAA